MEKVNDFQFKKCLKTKYREKVDKLIYFIIYFLKKIMIKCSWLLVNFQTLCYQPIDNVFKVQRLKALNKVTRVYYIYFRSLNDIEIKISIYFLFIYQFIF